MRSVLVAQPVSPDADMHWLLEAISLSRRCVPSATAFSVGAVLVAADGTVLSAGFSRERDPREHAEESALARLGMPGDRTAGVRTGDVRTGGDRTGGDRTAGGQPAGATGCRSGAGPVTAADLAGATMYSSLEPCASRASRPVPCADLIIASGIGRVVIAWHEPPIFVPGGGAARLREAGLTVMVIPELAAAAQAVNAHLLS